MGNKVILWGLGAMGTGIVKALWKRPGLELVGVIDNHPDKAVQEVGKVLARSGNTDFVAEEHLKEQHLIISANPEELLGKVQADLLLLATGSFTRQVFPQIKQALEAGLNVITIAEEMAAPMVQEPELAGEMDRLAKKHGVTLIGTGINPGFVLDTLIIALTAPCVEVKKIRAARINDLSPFGPTVMATQGVGSTPEEFAAGLQAGTIVGHVGFSESLYLIAEALGWKLDEIRQEREPIISNTSRQTPCVRVEPGLVAGCRHTAIGLIKGSAVIELEHPQQIHPEAEGIETGDYIWIEGNPNLNLTIKPEIPGGTGTIAMAVNLIPHVLEARPGLLTMKDLPVPCLRSVRANIQENKSAHRGEWVQIHQVLLAPGQRAPQNPDDTRRVPLEMRLKGFLVTDQAIPGEQVAIVTLSGRQVQGILDVISPRYTHDFGEPQSTLLAIGRELRLVLKEGEPAHG